uniref:Uncharacterized protein n=1 Tax=viral metagenome TaxID=1070528 RepID=A0A6C0BP49_9ZZZZ
MYMSLIQHQSVNQVIQNPSYHCDQSITMSYSSEITR